MQLFDAAPIVYGVRERAGDHRPAAREGRELPPRLRACRSRSELWPPYAVLELCSMGSLTLTGTAATYVVGYTV